MKSQKTLLGKKQALMTGVSVLGAIALLQGCSVVEEKREYEALADRTAGSTQQVIDAKQYGLTANARQRAQDVSKPYIISKPIPLSREMQLPAALRGEINSVLLYKDNADLQTIANRIQDATGILVQVTPDAYLPAESFGPRIEGGAGASAFPSLKDDSFDMMMGNLLTNDSARSFGPSSVGYQTTSSSKLPTGRHKLPTLLDAIAIKFGIYWKYDPQISALVLYRTETRYFEVKGLEMKATSEMTVGLSGAVGTSSGGVDSRSTAEMKFDANRGADPYQAISKKIEQFMTRSGKISEGSNGLIVVTDTKGALDRIEAFVETENKIRSRAVEFVFEEITIERNTSSSAGVQWDLMFQSAGDGNGVIVNGLNSLLEQQGAPMTMGASVGLGQWTGSSIALQALSKIGKVMDRKTNTFGSRNGMPATSGRPSRTKYIDKLEQTQSYSDSNAPTVSVSQSEEVSGRLLTVLPHAYNNGDISLAIKYDNTPDPVFEKQVLPDGSYVQSPTSKGELLVRSAIVRSGQPFVVNAYTHKNTASDERRMDKKLTKLMGGSDVAAQSEVLTVMILTAYVKER